MCRDGFRASITLLARGSRCQRCRVSVQPQGTYVCERPSAAITTTTITHRFAPLPKAPSANSSKTRASPLQRLMKRFGGCLPLTNNQQQCHPRQRPPSPSPFTWCPPSSSSYSLSARHPRAYDGRRSSWAPRCSLPVPTPSTASCGRARTSSTSAGGRRGRRRKQKRRSVPSPLPRWVLMCWW